MAGRAKRLRAKAYCFPDTNFFYHFKYFREIDWLALLNSGAVCLVISAPVVSEFERHKNDRTSQRRRNRSRTILKELEQLTRDAQPGETISIKSSTEILLDLLAPNMDEFLGRLDPQTVDDKILGHILQFKSEHPEDHVFLLSADLGMSLKARQLGIAAVTPPDDLRLRDEPTESERRVAELEGEMAAIRSRVPEATIGFYIDGGLQTEALFEWTDKSLSADDLAEKARRRHARVVARTMRGFEWKHKDADTIRADDAAIYDKYLKQLNKHLDVASTMLEIELGVIFRGSLPVENVVLDLSLPAHCRMYLAEDLPRRPTEPPVPDPWQSPVYPSVRLPPMTGHQLTVDSDWETVDQGRLRLRLDRVVQNVLERLEPFFLWFPPSSGVYGFGYTMNASNMARGQAGTLTITARPAGA